ncbi:hypothetical protein O6H91_01G043800 [Diphasiastrum complanatum]|uniref:Uncharacterized protein n=1 Tax=Diphasiastrum complanatum TaxID=34168 RepID=A0ACC2EQ61_DIPCM|nr:hypothetical protein O6H91_01G043800 [Diphasiastrum complanatum]
MKARGNVERRMYPCCVYVCLMLPCLGKYMALGSDLHLNVARGTQELSRIQSGLRRINKPAVKSIQSPDGDIIDCVLKLNQPALDHPKLKNKHIQESPSLRPTRTNPSEKHTRTHKFIQSWSQNGHCPIDTIPIRRSKESEIRHMNGSLKIYGQKSSGGVKPHSPAVPGPPTLNRHEHAISYLESGPYYGAKATINLWKPGVQMPNEFSLSQIWVLGGSFEDDLNSVEAGWQVSPEIYGDTNPRFFTYWTVNHVKYLIWDAFAIPCSTSNEIVIGGSISPVSSSNGLQYDITILIWKDPNTGHWWLEYGDYIVGYWPSYLFTHLALYATTLEWGGEVVNSEPDGRHTTTRMGSGVFAESGYGRASYFKNLGFVDSSNALRSPSDLQTFATYPDCYDILGASNSDWGAFFYYGGPGLNPLCR